VAARSLSVGNAAKHYCLQLIGRRVRAADGRLRILDVGCGDARNFVELLRAYPDVEYVGFDPSAAAVDAARRNLAGRRAEIFLGRLGEPLAPAADVVVSFSVLEHVRSRREYLDAIAASLAADGTVYLNYDYGHFGREATAVDRVKTLLRLQGPVDTDGFRRIATAAGLRIVDEKAFNTDLKLAFRDVPPERQDEFMQRWLDVELYLNELGLDRSPVWRTRNFVLERE
jgi:SAM-dependent methyltransferase